MRLIAFAHLTITDTATESLDILAKEYFRKFAGVPNPREKKKTMFLDSDLHDIVIIRGSFDLEINRYTPGLDGRSMGISLTLLKEFENNSEIRSSSFTPEFFQKLNGILGLDSLMSEKSMNFRTLNYMKTVSLKYDGGYPRFREQVDIPGISSIAFYVTGLNSARMFTKNHEMTDSFTITLGESAYMIRFVKCGEVWVELIERL